MTENHPPPDAGNALPGPAADQPVPAPSPAGLAPPHRTSPIAIASAACGTGALVLSVAYLGFMWERPIVCVSDRGGFHGVGIRPSK